MRLTGSSRCQATRVGGPSLPGPFLCPLPSLPFPRSWTCAGLDWTARLHLSLVGEVFFWAHGSVSCTVPYCTCTFTESFNLLQQHHPAAIQHHPAPSSSSNSRRNSNICRCRATVMCCAVCWLLLLRFLFLFFTFTATIVTRPMISPTVQRCILSSFDGIFYFRFLPWKMRGSNVCGVGYFCASFWTAAAAAAAAKRL